MNHLAIALLGVVGLGCGSDPPKGRVPRSNDGGVAETSEIVATLVPGTTATPGPKSGHAPTPTPTAATTLQAMPAQPSVAAEPTAALEPAPSAAPTADSSPGIQLPAKIPPATEVCAAPKQTCCCSPSDLLCAMRCGVWNQAAPAGMLASCLGQCRAGKANACLRAAMSFEQGVGVPRDPKRGQELRARTCQLDSFIGGNCPSASDETAR